VYNLPIDCRHPVTTPDIPKPSTGPHHVCENHPPAMHRPKTPWTATTTGHPQFSQPLILLLFYLSRFFIEDRTWGHSSTHRLIVIPTSTLSARWISFQDDKESSTVVLRLQLRTPWRGRGWKMSWPVIAGWGLW
jgi:hypothetical protein